jgi:YVTN family beta-propeller protein
MPELAPGDEFAGHLIEGIAGRGGMGVVYRARHLALDHLVALKVISPERAGEDVFKQRFVSESRIAVSIRHPNVVPIHHAGEERGLLFVTMDLIEGTDVRGLLNREGRLEPERALGILSQVAAALDAAHERGLVHRDIKPGNVLLEPREGSEHVFLTDFGLSKRIDATSDLTASGAFVGTLDYAAPEQIRGRHMDARGDVYALGCVTHEMLSGSAPFAKVDQQMAKMYCHVSEPPPRLDDVAPDVSAALSDVVWRALEKDPDRRYPSAGDLARAAAAAVEGRTVAEPERSVGVGPAAPTQAFEALEAEPAQAAPPPAETIEVAPPAEAARRPSPDRRRIALAALALVAVVAVAVLLITSGGDEEGGGGGEDEPALLGAPIGVAELPVGIAAGDKRVWVASRDGERVTRIDSGADAPEGDQIRVGGQAEQVAIGNRSTYVTVEDSVVRITPDGAVDDSFEPAAAAGRRGIAVGSGEAEGVWVANLEEDTLSRLDPDTGDDIVAPIEVGDGPRGVAIGEGFVWVTNRDDGTVSRVNPASNQEDQSIQVGTEPKGLALLEGDVWVANEGDRTVMRIDAEASRTTEEADDVIDVGAGPRDVVGAFGFVWVTLGGDDAVVRVDPGGDGLEQIDLPEGAEPEDIAEANGLLWVTNGERDSVSRIEP